MAERITRIEMTAFRGAPGTFSVELPEGRSVVVFGDNATGKSTVADALEWYFEGNIEHLRQEGRDKAIRNLAAPKDTPTSVKIGTTGSLGGIVILGQDPQSRAAQEAAGRETFLLSGRTLAAFVESRKAEKWKTLAELLGLEGVDQVRLDLQRARNELSNAAEDANARARAASQTLSGKVRRVDEQGIMEALGDLCRKAGVAVPGRFSQVLHPEWSGSITGSDKETERAVGLKTLTDEMRSSPPTEPDLSGVANWNAVVAEQEPGIQARLRLFQAAKDLLAGQRETEACPLCGQDISAAMLSEHVVDVLESLRGAGERFSRARLDVESLAATIDNVAAQARRFRDRAGAVGVELQESPVSPADALRRAVGAQEAVDHAEIRQYSEMLREWHGGSLREVEKVPVPKDTGTEGILVDIGVITQQARSWRQAVERADHVGKAAGYAEQIFNAYQRRQHDYFKTILDRISGRVADIYAKLHPGEDLRDVCIEPWGDKGLELAVTFHGSRQKPPHGVLSESHLNSLAVAVFLAMAETFNEDLGFVVLDDVVNSFDNEHRGELAALLATEFRDRQLIVLTHDHLFYDRLCRLAQDWKRVEFTSWDYEEGPRTKEYQTGLLLEKAQRALVADDVDGAATKGRRALEELLGETCEGLQAPVPFRRGFRNDRREIGELVMGLRRGLADIAKPFYEELKPLLAALDADVGAALNVEAHADKGRASPAEIRAALARISELDRMWTCASCGTRVWSKGTPESCSCRCGREKFPPVRASSAATPS